MFDIAAIRHGHSRFMAANRRMVDDVLDDAAKQAEHHVRDKVQFKHRTGRLLRSTKGKRHSNRAGGRMSVSATAKHAVFLEKGTRPHVIRPKRRRALRFLGFRGIVFAKKVNHPGTRPYLFLSAARDHSFHWAGSTFNARMRRIARRF